MPITATRTTNFRPLIGDQDGDGYVDAGDILRHTLTLNNTGTAATGVVVNDTLFGSTETGLVNISPIAFHDAYTAVGNTLMEIGNATSQTGPQSSPLLGNILSNDIGALGADDVPGFTISALQATAVVGGSVTATSQQGGTVTLITTGGDAGSFTYISNDGFTGTDTFTYTIRDAGFDGIAGNADDLTSIGTVTITVTGQVWYVDGNAGAGGDGTSTNPFNTVTLAGTASDAGDYIYVQNSATGTITLDANQQLSGTGADLVVAGFQLANDSTNSTVTGASGFTVTLGSNSTLAGININGVGGITGTGFGTVTVNDVNINTTGQGLSLTTGAFAGTGFDNVTSAGGVNNVNLDAVTGTVNLGTGALSGATGIGFDVNAGNGSVDYNGTITHGGNARAIEVTNKTGGTVDFDGSVTSNGSSDGIHLNSNTGATINFDGGLTVNITGATGFNANAGGTVNVTGSTNTINSGNGVALNVVNTTIGAGDLNFQSIAVNGATNGIILNNTGTSGNLSVTGDGADAGTTPDSTTSGGTIQNTTGDGVSLTSTMDVYLGGMTITNSDGSGIRGTTVNGFVLDTMSITGNGDQTSPDESGVELVNLSGTAIGGLHRTEIRNSTISNSHEVELQITNSSGTLTDFRFTNSTLSSNGATAVHGSLFNFLATGTANMTLTVAGSTFTGNTVAGALTGNAIFADASGGAINVNVGTSTFTNNNVGVGVSTATTGTATFDIHDNTMTGNRAIGINIFTNANATGLVSGKIQDNVVGTQGVAGSGSALGRGIQVAQEGGGIMTLLIDDNTVQSVAQFEGISVNDSVVAGTINLTLTDNILRDIPMDRGIIVQQTIAGGTMNATISGNSFINVVGLAGDPNGTVLRIREETGADFNIVQLQATAANVATELDNANNIAMNKVSVGGTPDYGQPAPPQPLIAVPPPFDPEAPGPDAEDDGSGDEVVTPAPDPIDPDAPPSNQPIVVDDGIVSAAELAMLVEAAIQRWADAGATAEQLAAMRATTVTVANLPGFMLGSSAAGEIVVDNNAAGFNWFIDATPGDDSEFSGGGTRLAATPNTVAAIRVDLLTTIMHELGHQIGLQDSYASDDSDELMFGMISAGERRLPGEDDAALGDGTHVTGTGFALTAISIGNIPVGQTVIIQWESTVAGYNSVIVPTLTNFSTITGNNPGAFSVNSSPNDVLSPTSAPLALDSLTLGGTVWNDNGTGVGGIAFNGLKDGTEAGHDGVLVSLFADLNNDNVADTPGTALLNTTTAGGGHYSFTGLAPGNYIVRIDQDNFDLGGSSTVLVNRVTTTGNPDPDGSPDIDHDDNGYQSGGAGTPVFSNAITLAHNTEPTADLTGQLDINNTLDFGFVLLNQGPVNTVPAAAQPVSEDGTLVFSIAGGNPISVADADSGAGPLIVTLSIADGALTPAGGSGAAIGGSGTNNLTITGTLTQINNALNGLSYTPPANANGPRTLTVTTNDQGNTGVDPGLTGDGTSEQDSDPVSITINPVNDAPVRGGDGTEDMTAIVEDVPSGGQLVSAIAGGLFSDPLDNQTAGGGSSANSFAGIAVHTNNSGANGQWQYSTNGGTNWSDIGAASTALAVLIGANALVRFSPTQHFNGAAPTITFVLVDDSGGALTSGATASVAAVGGTTRYSSGAVVLSQQVTPVNDAPTYSSAAPQPTFTENGPAVVIAGSVTVADDQANFAGGSLTIAITSGATAGDALGINTSSTPGVGIEFDGVDYSFNGQVIGSIVGGSGTSVIIGLTVNATPAAVDALTEAFTALSVSEYPTSTARVVTFTLVDGGGGQDTTSFARTISVVPVNDQPAVTVDPSALAVDEQVAEAIAPTGLLADLDLDARGGGAGDYSGSTLTIEVNGGATPQDVLSVVNGAGFTVNGSNLENGLSQVFATVSGGSGGPLEIAFIGSGLATSQLADAVLQAVQYRYDGNVPPATITLDLTLDDGAPANADQGAVGSNPATGTASIIVNITNTPENQLPTIDLDADDSSQIGTGFTTAYTEGNALGVLIADGDTLIADPDALDNVQSATITIQSAVGGDQLILDPIGGGFTVGGSTTTSITITGTGTAAQYVSFIETIRFLNTSDDPTAGGATRLIHTIVHDGTAGSLPAVTTIDITAVNDQPALSATGDNPTFTEGNAAVDLFDPVSAATVEAGQSFTSLTLTVTNVTDGANEVLNVDGTAIALTSGGPFGPTTQGLSVSVSLLGTLATVTITIPSLGAAALQAIVDGLSYVNTSQNPTDANREVTIAELVDSGSNSPPNDSTTALNIVSTVNVNPLNDPASITGTATGDVTEAGGTNNGTAGTPMASANLGSTDVDNPDDLWQIASGAATIGGYGTYAVDGTGVWTYTLNDNHAAVQALNGLATLTDTFNATTVDGTAQLVTVTIHAQNDASVAHNDAFTTDEATAITAENVLAANGSGADSDIDDATQTVSGVTGGTVGTQFALPSGALLTLNANGTFNYDPSGVFNTTPTPGSGASNQPRVDQFFYTLTGGSTATVTVTVNGLDTNDVLLSAPGGTSLSGGTGDDIYFIDHAGNVAVEASGEGQDIVYASLTHVLAAGSEIEILSAVDNGATNAFDLHGNEFANQLWGNNGVNFLSGGGVNDVLLGFNGDDLLMGNDGADWLDGGAGHDALHGAVGDDTLIGGSGNDFMDGGTGANGMYGGAGDDTYFAENSGDFAIEAANEGQDIVYSSVTRALIAGSEIEILSALDNDGTGALDLHGNEFANELWGNDGVNILSGSGGNDVLLGFGGADLLIGGDAADTLDGGDDHDALYGSAGNDTLTGGSGNDYMEGGTGADGMYGGAGDDVYFVENSGDFAIEAAGQGHDIVYASVTHALEAGSEIEILSALDTGATTALDLHGSAFANELWGNNGINFLSGGGGGDVLLGFGGADLLIGGAGDDWLDGGNGSDALNGSADIDTFAFTTALGAANVDTISDFEAGVDKIALSALVFLGLGTGELDPSAFVIGTQASGDGDRIVYDSATGALYFDSDGGGGDPQIQFATLAPGLSLSASDFFVI